MMIVDPMMATSGPLPEDEERWAFEPKWDGFRAIVHCDGGRLRVLARRGTDLAGRLPELAPLAGFIPPGTTLDGELAVFDAGGRVDFDGMRRRGFGQPSPGRLLFVAFDVLALADQEVVGKRWDVRRSSLAWRSLSTPAKPIFDAIGHGLGSSQLAHLAVSSYRHSRRSGLDLEATYQVMDAAVAARSQGEEYVTCLLGRLDLLEGHLT